MAGMEGRRKQREILRREIQKGSMNECEDFSNFGGQMKGQLNVLEGFSEFKKSRDGQGLH